jgi:hypothetical protein
MSTLRYIALFVCALFTVFVGVYTLNVVVMLLALPLAALGLIGAVSPTVISRRRWLSVISVVGLILLASEMILVTGSLAATKRRRVELIVDETGPRRVRVVYGVADGPPQLWSWTRRIEIPASNIAFVQYADNGSWYSADNPHPLRVMTRRVTGIERKGSGSWVTGGYTDAGGCHFEYDEYRVGNPSGVAGVARAAQFNTGWLDSLNTWGVECRRGRLFRHYSGSIPNLQRTGEACYYLADGRVTCSSIAGR